MGIEIRALTNFKTAQLYLHSVIEFRFRTSFAIPCDSASSTGPRNKLEIYSGSLSLSRERLDQYYSTGLFDRELRTNAKVRKFSGFFEFSISTSAYLGIGVYGDLADSAKVHQLERTFRGTVSLIPIRFSTFSGCTRRKV